MFCAILLVTSVLQVFIVEFGGNALHVTDGLSAELWSLSLLLGLGSLPVQQVINVIFNVSVDFKRKWRQRQRYNRDRAFFGHPTS
jgi:Ca2+ transporting ATPase